MISLEIIKHFAINRIIIVKGMLPNLDIVIRKSKHLLLAERKYMMKSVNQFNNKEITFESFNKKLTLVLIKYPRVTQILPVLDVRIRKHREDV